MGLYLDALTQKESNRVPIWFMRQAGRYLPEYRKMRETCPDFLSFCYTPEKASEVTLQPIRRFGFDASILFSDILVIPDALGMDVSFVKGEGPKLKAWDPSQSIPDYHPSPLEKHLAPVAQTVRILRRELPTDTDLIGFAGAPWTVACYMVQGSGSKDFAKVRETAYAHPQWFGQLIALITQATIDYLAMQIEAGAQAVQLFDSWGGMAPPAQAEQYVKAPAKIIRDVLKKKFPDVPFVSFVKGMQAALPDYIEHVQPDAVGIDMHAPLEWVRDVIQPLCVVQGNLDPLLLASDKQGAIDQTQRILECWGKRPFIFNLGHGIVPHTPIENVEAVLQVVREFT